MLYTIITGTLEKAGRKWNIGGKLVNPTEDDIERILDHAATRLYDSKVGDRLEVGGLIVEKKHRGHDVYVMVGSYE